MFHRVLKQPLANNTIGTSAVATRLLSLSMEMLRKHPWFMGLCLQTSHHPASQGGWWLCLLFLLQSAVFISILKMRHGLRRCRDNDEKVSLTNGSHGSPHELTPCSTLCSLPLGVSCQVLKAGYADSLLAFLLEVLPAGCLPTWTLSGLSSEPGTSCGCFRNCVGLQAPAYVCSIWSFWNSNREKRLGRNCNETKQTEEAAASHQNWPVYFMGAC